MLCKRKETSKKSTSQQQQQQQIPEEKYVTVESQVILIRKVCYWEIGIATIILFSQTTAVAASYDFASRSLTGIWTSWFFFIAAAVALFWSSRCTFNGMLAVLVLQIIAATMSIPIFTACSVMFGVYPFVWSKDEDGTGAALVGSSIIILVTNIIMMTASVAQMFLNAFNGYNCYFLAYVGKPKVEEPANNYEDRSIASSSSISVEDDDDASSVSTQGPSEPEQPVEPESTVKNHRPINNGAQRRQQFQQANYDENNTTLSMPQPPPDLTLTHTDMHVIKYCGAAGVIIAIIIFCCQIAMFALAKETGIGIGVGIWAAALYSITGVVTVYSGWKPTSQRAIIIFVLQIIQLVLSVPLAGIAYYTVAVFGSCMQANPVDRCPKYLTAGLFVTILGGVMAISGTVQGLISLVLVLICSQTVCGIRCMISGATVYPTL